MADVCISVHKFLIYKIYSFHHLVNTTNCFCSPQLLFFVLWFIFSSAFFSVFFSYWAKESDVSEKQRAEVEEIDIAWISLPLDFKIDK